MSDWEELRERVVGLKRGNGAFPAKLSEAERLSREAEDLDLWHTPDGEAYATFDVKGHRESWPVRSKEMKGWLVERYYGLSGKPPTTQALRDTIALLEARSRYEGPERPVHVRVAEEEDRIYVDRGDPDWTAIEITPGDYRVVEHPPVRFRRSRGTTALPVPERGGELTELREYIQLEREEDWYLLAAWLVAALSPRGPYAILALHGERGSGKSTVARILRSLVDPSAAPLRSDPRSERDLMISARNSWLIALDNLSRIQPWLSDALCRLSTGGGFSTRELYSDSNELIIDAMRPIILTGIEHLGSRGDLLERSIVLDLPRIHGPDRRSEEEFWSTFDAARPRLFGALLDAAARTRKHLGEVKLERLPRMADFARRGVALERALGWPDGAFLEAYRQSMGAASALSLEGDPVAEAILDLAGKGEFAWRGTSRELLDRLVSEVDEATKRNRAWPANARVLGGRLRRLAPGLRDAGLDITFSREGGSGRRQVKISRPASSPSQRLSTTDAPPEPGDGLDGRDGKKRDSSCRRGESEIWL